MMENKNQIQWLLNAATSAFNEFSDTAKLDAEILLCHVLECNRTYLFTWPDKELNPEQVTVFKQYCEKRKQGNPIAHIVGYRDFWTLKLKVSASTLIPRPDTETLVEQALTVVQNVNAEQCLGLDLGTGTGAVALSLASELPDWQWLGVDFIEDAVSLATENAISNNISNCTFIQSDWFKSVPPKKYDLIVSNPPYIEENDPHLSEGDVRFEPLSALTSSDNGLADIKIIVAESRAYLSLNGIVMIEHGYNQAAEVRAIFIQNGFNKVNTIKDLSANDRITVGYF